MSILQKSEVQVIQGFSYSKNIANIYTNTFKKIFLYKEFFFIIFIFSQIYYETTRNIEKGEELLLGPKEAIRLDGSTSTGHCSTGSTAGSSHNGEASETDRNSDHLVSSKPGESEVSEDEEEGVKCIKCDKVFGDIFT